MTTKMYSWTKTDPEAAARLQNEIKAKLEDAGFSVRVSSSDGPSRELNVFAPKSDPLVWNAEKPSAWHVINLQSAAKRRPWYVRLWRWATRKPAIDFFVAGSARDPAVKFKTWLRGQPRITDWCFTDGGPFGVYFEGRVDGTLHELQQDGPDALQQIWDALKAELRK